MNRAHVQFQFSYNKQIEAFICSKEVGIEWKGKEMIKDLAVKTYENSDESSILNAGNYG